MAGLGISVCFWYVDSRLIDEVRSVLVAGKYEPVVSSFKDEKLLKEHLIQTGTDLIIADFDLPDTLRQFVEKVQKSDAFYVPLIYLVGEKNEAKAAESLRRGVWDYILKDKLLKLVPTVYSSQKYGKVLRKNQLYAQENLRKEELSKILIESEIDPIMIINDNWEIQFLNDQMADLLNYPEFSTEKIMSNVRSKAVDQYGNAHTEFISILNKDVPIQSGQFYVGFHVWDERMVFGLLKIRRIYSQELKEDFIAISYQDTTELRRIEKELLESELKYLSIFNAVSDGMLLIDNETFEIIEFNKSVRNIFSFSEKQTKSDVVRALSGLRYGYGPKNIGNIVSGVGENDPANYLYYSTREDGSEIWTENTLSHFTIGEEDWLLLVIRDIQGQKELEKSLRDSREHFKNLAEGSPDIVMRFDMDKRHIYVNENTQQHLNLSRELFYNKTHDEMATFPAEKVEIFEAALDTVIKTQKEHTVEFSLEGLAAHTKYYEWRLFPEFDGEGKLDSILAIARDISVSKRAVMALEQSEDRLNLAVEATRLGLWDWDMKTDEVYFSPMYFQMLGYEPNELPQRFETLEKLMHPEDREPDMIQREDNLMNKVEIIENEFRLLCKDGSYKWIRSRGKVVSYDDSGKVERMIGTHEDISDRKRNEDIQSVLVNVSSAVNTTKNLDELFNIIQYELGRIIDTTNCFLALYNEEDNTLSMPFHMDEFDTFEDFPVGKTLTGYVLETGKTQLIDANGFQELEDNGTIEIIGTPCTSWLGVPLYITQQIIGVFVVQSYSEEVIYTQDDVSILEFVSDQIAIAIERKKDQDRIKENQEKQRRIFEASPDPLVVVDKKGNILDFNSAMLVTQRITSEKVIGQNIFNFIHKDSKRDALMHFKKTWEEGFFKNLEFTVQRADGSVFECEVSTGAIFNSEGEGDSIVIIYKDISERKENERKLREAKERAEESDRLKTAFLSNMSHEIRTPMNAIVGFSDLLNDEGIKPEDRREFIAQINMGAENLMHLIDDIIDISKIEAGQIKVNKTDCVINDLIHEQIVLHERVLERQDKAHIELKLNWTLKEKNLVINTDPFRLKQVVSNLLNNAIKFTDKGSIELKVELLDRFVRFAVVDTGVGIDEEKQSKIFARFMQGHDTKVRIYGGTGLGLAISQNLCRILGGEIGVISELGNGSEFWFILPNEREGITLSEELTRNKVVTDNWEGVKILIAEDDNSNFNLLKEVLKPTNAEIIRAKDGQQTISLFNEFKDSISLVLMDIQMPLMDGYECTRYIKSIKPEMPVIAQTAYAMSGEKDLCIEAGCDNYISKPIQVKSLIKMLGKYI